MKDLKCKDNQFLLADDISSLLRLTLTHHDNFLVSELACSAGVFFERAICSRKCHVETSRREEEIGRVKGSGEGKGREKGKRRIFFSPLPCPSPLSFFRHRTYRKGYYFYSPQSSTVIKSKMAATTTLRTRTRFCPPKIPLHCKL